MLKDRTPYVCGVPEHDENATLHSVTIWRRTFAAHLLTRLAPLWIRHLRHPRELRAFRVFALQDDAVSIVLGGGRLRPAHRVAWSCSVGGVAESSDRTADSATRAILGGVTSVFVRGAICGGRRDGATVQHPLSNTPLTVF